jgi:hypothetical protein
MRGRPKSRRTRKSSGARSHQPAAQQASREVAEEQRPTAETVRQAQRAPESLGPAELLQLQRIVGNRAVSRALGQRQRARPPSEKSPEPRPEAEPAQETEPDVEAVHDLMTARGPGDNGRQAPIRTHALAGPALTSRGDSGAVQRGLWSKIKKAAKKVGGGIKNLVKKAVAGAKTAWRGAKSVAQRIGKGAKSLAEKALSGAKKAFGGAKKLAGKVWGKAKSLAKSGWNTAKKLAGKFWGGARGFWNQVKSKAKQVWAKGKAAAKKVWNVTKSTSSKLWGGAKKLWNKAKRGAKKLWSGARRKATSFWGKIKSFWRSAVSKARSFWNKVKNTAKSLWAKAKRAVNRLKQKVKQLWSKAKQLAKRVWSKVVKGVKAAWKGIGWFGRQLWSKLKGIYYRAVNWIKQLPTRLKRLLLHLWEGVKSLKPWSLSWWKSLGKASTWKGFGKWLGTAVIQLLEVVGIGEIYETVADFIKFNSRELTGREKAMAQSVFGGSIDYNLVRVDERALIGPSWTKREYVSFHIINGWGGIDDETLIHEMTHVWQYTKMGAIYMPKAIGAQASKEGYDYGGLDELKKRQAAGQGLTSFNLEQQAMIVQHYYTAKYENRIDKKAVAPADKAATVATYEHFAREVRA